MDEAYDVIVLGTGLKECILSSLLSSEGKKILHIDRNNFYGGDLATVSPIEMLFERFNIKKDLKDYENGKDWNVDLVSKFLMANGKLIWFYYLKGKLVKLLSHTDVTRYLEFRCVEGSYFWHKECIHKVPCDQAEALGSSLMGLQEKNRFRDFLVWVTKVDSENSSTWADVYKAPLDITKHNITIAFDNFKIDNVTQNFIGHAICLYQDDSYKENIPAIEVVQKMQLYSQSVCRFGKSPYVYPLYGVGELSQAFARFSAVHGGTYMLDKIVDEIVLVDGKVEGVRSGTQTAKCKMVICDPSYAKDRTKKVGQVVRAICILKHPISSVNNGLSTQIIIPQSDFSRKHDIYVSCLSHYHKICPKHFFVAHVATIVETDTPNIELEPGLKLLGEIEQVFYSIEDLFEPTDDGHQSKIFISSSYDASTHFESTCLDVLAIYERITGHPFDFNSIKKTTTE